MQSITEINPLALFTEIIGKILHLYPEEFSTVTIFSSSNKAFAIPVFIGEEGKNKLVSILSKHIALNSKGCEKFSLLDRYMFVSHQPLRRTQDSAIEQVFPVQILFRADLSSEIMGHCEKLSSVFRIDTNLLFEACLVSYFLHEFRHIFQILKFDCKKLPFTVENHLTERDDFSNEALKFFWRRLTKQHIAIQKKILRNTPNKKVLLHMERDAMFVQFLALTCWLNENTSRQEKISRLRTILTNEKGLFY